jgi:acetylornithine deacetylase/succinyl-diaminopimelate desuccinylase-like protein
MLLPILAVEALLTSTGGLPVNVKFFFEGQEEVGSPDMPAFIDAHRELLACDLVLSADGSQWDEEHAVLVVGRRGLCALQIDVTGAAADVHSGTYGGTFLNPIHALADMLSSMRREDGRIAVAGFYDAVKELPDTDRRHIGQIPFDASLYRRKLGVKTLFGESGYSTYERAWVRPTLEVNGIWGGFRDEGLKTVIPAAAHAKISCRLVPDQDPEDILEKVLDHIRRCAPDGVEVTAYGLEGTAVPFTVPVEHPGNAAAAKVLSALYGKAPYVGRMGGTIPVSGLFLRYLNAYMISFAFGLNDENIHAPDEFFRVGSFIRGQQAYCMVLEELAAGNMV